MFNGSTDHCGFSLTLDSLVTQYEPEVASLEMLFRFETVFSLSWSWFLVSIITVLVLVWVGPCCLGLGGPLLSWSGSGWAPAVLVLVWVGPCCLGLGLGGPLLSWSWSGWAPAVLVPSLVCTSVSANPERLLRPKFRLSERRLQAKK